MSKSKCICAFVVYQSELCIFGALYFEQFEEVERLFLEYNTKLGQLTEGLMNPQLVFFSDEAWFHLTGHQNTRYWHSENPHRAKEILFMTGVEFGVLLAQDE
ncbi:hypothetical protein ANN_21889 [Periplaneta americana]|uniref:Per a allergen n=1 Tax=Periplaneta americana TaxID=6978 RepID=A0ABQ8S6M8_PERAM|nr:hypothetical protein ANN_21889 [Periplaneta americana]